MNAKQVALNTILVLGGIGVLTVSCSDSDEQVVDRHVKKEHVAPAVAHVDSVSQHLNAGSQPVLQAAAQGPAHKAHWSYAGEAAPHLWGELSADYALCGSGKSQSPIDISAVTISPMSDIVFSYQSSSLEVVNNGHTVQVNYDPGSYIVVNDKQYELLQFHFHSPSEHTVGGRAYDMVAHLVHKAADGQLGVIGVLFRVGEVNPALGKVWLNMPSRAGSSNVVSDITINAADLLPQGRAYFNYSGSLTTPPCSEGVNWMVLAHPVTVSVQQVREFTSIFDKSTRPVQPVNGRAVYLSN